MDLGESSRNALVDNGPRREAGMNFPVDGRNQRLDQTDFARDDLYQDQNRLRQENPVVNRRQDQRYRFGPAENFRMPRYVELTKIEGIEKLNGKNFKTWKTDLEIALSERNLWTLVNGERDEREPVDIQDQQLAYKIIYQCCETHIKDMISDTRDALVAWRKIQETFNPKNMITQINSVKNLFNVEQKPGEKIIDYISRVRNLYRDYRQTGNDDINDRVIAQLMIIGLDEEFEIVKSMTSTFKNEDLTSVRIEEMLLNDHEGRPCVIKILRIEEIVKRQFFIPDRNNGEIVKNKSALFDPIKCVIDVVRKGITRKIVGSLLRKIQEELGK
jgi:hypothetical protein